MSSKPQLSEASKDTKRNTEKGEKTEQKEESEEKSKSPPSFVHTMSTAIPVVVPATNPDPQQFKVEPKEETNHIVKNSILNPQNSSQNPQQVPTPPLPQTQIQPLAMALMIQPAIPRTMQLQPRPHPIQAVVSIRSNSQRTDFETEAEIRQVCQAEVPDLDLDIPFGKSKLKKGTSVVDQTLESYIDVHPHLSPNETLDNHVPDEFVFGLTENDSSDFELQTEQDNLVSDEFVFDLTENYSSDFELQTEQDNHVPDEFVFGLTKDDSSDFELQTEQFLGNTPLMKDEHMQEEEVYIDVHYLHPAKGPIDGQLKLSNKRIFFIRERDRGINLEFSDIEDVQIFKNEEFKITITCENDKQGDGEDEDLQKRLSHNISNVNIRDTAQVHTLNEEQSLPNGGHSQRKASPKSRVEIPDVSPVSKRVIDQGETIKIPGTEVIEEHDESDFISVAEELDESLENNCEKPIEQDEDSTEYDSNDELAPSDYLEPYNKESDEED